MKFLLALLTLVTTILIVACAPSTTLQTNSNSPNTNSSAAPAPANPNTPPSNSPSANNPTATRVANAQGANANSAPTPASTTTIVKTNVADVDITNLPLGDGKLSTKPQAGWIWPCRTDPNAGGAFTNGAWIKSDGTYDLTQKAIVDGNVTWASNFKVTVEGNKRVFTSNDLPNHGTGVYPIASSDDAYKVDRNPNKINSQNIRVELNANPTLAAQASCAPGAIGFLLTGSVIFNALDAPGRDAVAHETQDACGGHPQESGVYHYHSLTNCLADNVGSDGHSSLMGYMIDGFGIFGHHGAGGKTLTSADLDECHGHTHEIEWDGKRVVLYHYHATYDFPYTAGCMRGTYDQATARLIGNGGNTNTQPGQPQPQGQSPQGQPNLAAAAKKLGITEQQLRDALGPPPPDLVAAARKLGIAEQALRDALGLR